MMKFAFLILFLTNAVALICMACCFIMLEGGYKAWGLVFLAALGGKVKSG